jgi:hypothetical protein
MDERLKSECSWMKFIHDVVRDDTNNDVGHDVVKDTGHHVRRKFGDIMRFILICSWVHS